MDETKRQDVNTMTAEQVRREIAELLGWRDLVFGPYGLTLRYEEAHDTLMGYPPGVEPSPNVMYSEPPNWPGNDGAAIRLCFEVLDRLKVAFHAERVSSRYVFQVDYDSVSYLNMSEEAMFIKGRDALALSRLALLALRGLAVSDG